MHSNIVFTECWFKSWQMMVCKNQIRNYCCLTDGLLLLLLLLFDWWLQQQNLSKPAGAISRSAKQIQIGIVCSCAWKYVFSCGEKHCPPPNYWVIGPQHRFHWKNNQKQRPLELIYIHAVLFYVAVRETLGWCRSCMYKQWSTLPSENLKFVY